MGTITLLLPDDLSGDLVGELGRACVAGGPDNMPWPTNVQVQSGRLLVRRAVEESGYLVAPWDIDGFGRLMGSSSTLMEREPPYQLQVELARGKVNQVRCQTADWRSGGLQVAPSLEHIIREASVAFGRAVTGAADRASQAQTALTLGYQAAEQLVSAYVDQVFHIRHQQKARLDTQLGCRLATSIPQGESATALGWACNSIALPFAWRDIEPADGNFQWGANDALLDWALEQNFAVNAGPLIDFSPGALPDWLWLYERDLTSIARFMGRFVETVVRRYRSQVRRWQLTNGSNWSSLLGLTEEEMLWLTVRLAEVARQLEPGLEVSVGIVQPWGEYMAVAERAHSPFIFADNLIRSGLNLAALDLELVMGVSPRGSYCRDALDMSRLMDLYALLGTPLRVTLGYPSSDGPDPLADQSLKVTGGAWHAAHSPAAQAEWASAYTGLALSKPYVQSVQWVHFSDADPHQFPGCGVIDAAGQPKPSLERLHQLRERHLR